MNIMHKILRYLSNVPQDKLLHFFYGTLMAAPLVAFTNPLISSAFVMMVAIFKELYDDLSGKGNIEVMDVVFTIAPVIIMNIVKYI
jgi:hypothetical protein